MDTRHALDQLVQLFKEEMTDNLAGIYLHGSLAMGCFNPAESDIDLLVVAYEKLSVETNKRIAKRLLALHDELPNRRGIELSIILESCLTDFVYPTPFEFHYSDYHREKYRTDENYICGGFEDADLAAHFTVTYHRGVALYGKPVREAFAPVGRQYYLDSILSDIEGAPHNIVHSPVYYTLNLCRVLFFLQEGIVASKKEGGEWGALNLPLQYRDTVRLALSEYAGNPSAAKPEPEALTDFAQYMMNAIGRLTGHEC
ncbi:aminoglycoside adenylyltransferase domain-containing protein [Paenibacillus rhizophilus]|uniref:Spectinomycin 9-adenylyltransferase n=1 Tax=Paenibacillus rhizophilus TaxID=1850366 RepID=A0A3N9P4U7_9BACL|nr:aminoglycoside adenylyltransferase domain-containing protein [Paenibacillus rhizophilus]RQW11203.1 DUF4111 domain-containing protein [Paenibacillus rhizophilus]